MAIERALTARYKRSMYRKPNNLETLMKTTLSLALAVALVLAVLGEITVNAATPAPSISQSEDVTGASALGKNALSLVLLGRGFPCSLNYDRMPSDDLGADVRFDVSLGYAT